MKVIVDNKIPFVQGRMESVGIEVVYASPESITSDLVRDADALMIRTRTRCDSMLLEGSSVRMIATATIGTDHIDIGWCGSNGITVKNAAGCNAPGVAQYVWSSLLRNGFDTSIHKIGVVGVGNVGGIVAEWGRLLGGDVMVCDPIRRDEGYQDYDYRSLEELLESCDAVTIHVPLTRDGLYPTYHMIDAPQLALMREDSILVNSSRGPVVNNTSWRDYLASGRSKGVIDVWEGEPDIDRNLLGLARIATPHIAGYSLEGKERATRMSLEALSVFFEVEIPTDGLCGDYKPTHAFPVNASEIITNSYNPYSDDMHLRKSPGLFETLRSKYKYRREPDFES